MVLGTACWGGHRLDWVTFILGTGPSSATNSCVALARQL